MSNLTLKKIIAPSLSKAGYGKGINDQFDSINENFRILSNHDFVKGDTGTCIRVVKYHLFEKDSYDRIYITNIGKSVLLAILDAMLNVNNITSATYTSLSSSITASNHLRVGTINDTNTSGTLNGLLNSFDETKVVNGYSLLGLLTLDTGFEVIESYNPTDTYPEYIKIGAVNRIIFKDKRFNNSDLSDGISMSDTATAAYVNAIDMSCVISMDSVRDDNDNIIGSRYNILQDIPSLYYSSKYKRFCWKIGGSKTGMIAQGPAGAKGADSVVHVVKVDINRSTSKEILSTKTNNEFIDGYLATGGSYIFSDIKITSYLDNESGQWIGATSSLFNESLFAQGHTAIAFVNYETSTSERRSDTFVTNVSSVGPAVNSIKIILSNQCKIDVSNSEMLVETTFNNISYDKSLRGLHVPYKASSNASQTRHMIWSCDGSGSQGSAEGKVDMPILNIAPLINYTNTMSSIGTVDSSTDANAPKLKITYPQIYLGSNNIIVHNTGVITISTSTGRLKIGPDNNNIDLTPGKLSLTKNVGSGQNLTIDACSYLNSLYCWEFKNTSSNASIVFNTGTSLSNINKTGAINIGATNDHIVIDNQYIQGRIFSGGACSSQKITLQPYGGGLQIGSSSNNCPLSIYGISTFESNIIAKAALNVTGATTLQNNLTVNGTTVLKNINAASLNTSGNIQVNAPSLNRVGLRPYISTDGYHITFVNATDVGDFTAAETAAGYGIKKPWIVGSNQELHINFGTITLATNGLRYGNGEYGDKCGDYGSITLATKKVYINHDLQVDGSIILNNLLIPNVTELKGNTFIGNNINQTDGTFSSFSSIANPSQLYIGSTTQFGNPVLFKESTQFNKIATFSDQVKLKVNGVSDVYGGMPVGSIIMYGKKAVPEHWFPLLGWEYGLTIEDNIKMYGDKGSTDANNAAYTYRVRIATFMKNNDIGQEKTKTAAGKIANHMRAPNFARRVPIGFRWLDDKDITSSTYNPLAEGDDRYLFQTGGEETHQLTTAEMPSHAHKYWDIYHSENSHGMTSPNITGNNTWPGSNKTDYDNSGYQMKRTSDATGDNQAHNNIPPYITVLFIMKYE